MFVFYCRKEGTDVIESYLIPIERENSMQQQGGTFIIWDVEVIYPE